VSLFSSSYSFSRYEQPVCSRALDWSPQLCKVAAQLIMATKLEGGGIWDWPSPSIGHHRIEHRACFAQGRRCSCRSGRCLQGESPPLLALFGCHPWAQRQLSRNQVQSFSIGLHLPADTAEPVSLEIFDLVPEPGRGPLRFSSRVKTAGDACTI
jgi:hypothetical protein